MDEKRFQALLAAYGADAARWPQPERAAAIQFAQTHTDAAAWIARARQLDNALGELADYSSSENLRERILLHAQRQHQIKPHYWPFKSVWRPAVGLAASLLLGVLFGVAQPAALQGQEQEKSYDLTSLAFNASDEDGGL